MKRFWAMLLSLAMITGMFPVVAAVENSADAIYAAAFSDAVTVNGILDETDWHTYGKMSDGTAFGILWDSDNLYIAVNAEDASVEINGASVTPVSHAYAEALELKVSLTELGIFLQNYNQALSLILNAGSGFWTGTVTNSSLSRGIRPTWNTRGASVNLWTAAGNAASVGSEAITDGMRLYNKYAVPVDPMDNAAGGRVYWIDTIAQPWSRRDGTVSVEMDIMLQSMPEMTIKTHSYTHVFPAYGMNFAIADGNGEGITTAVTNTPEGLYFVIYSERGSLRSAPIGKELGTRFHLTQVLDDGGNLNVYVDDILIGTFTGALREKKKMASIVSAGFVSFNLWSDADRVLTEDHALDCDVSVTNVTFGTFCGKTPLDSLDFYDICGTNQSASAVTSNLNLMTVWSNGQLSNIPLTWSSSHPDIVNPITGTVTPTGEYADVTLTASITGTENKKRNRHHRRARNYGILFHQQRHYT